MPEKGATEKMRLKVGMTAALLHVPEGVRLDVPEGVHQIDRAAGADFLLEFVTTQAEAEERVRALQPHVGGETLAWIAYPKGSKAAGHDVNRDSLMTFARSIGLVVVANIAVDQRWSAVRLRPSR